MATTYRSEVDTWLLVVLLGAMGIALFAGVAVIADPDEIPGRWWVVANTLGVGVVLPAWLLLDTRYILEPRLLTIRCGPCRWRIPLADITSVSPGHSVLSAPALSLERLRIEYGTGREVLISPCDRPRFLRELDALRRRA